jgi:formyltetrahydrofolate-dependent phosphoribosylglycinamide formyltransferase
MTRLGVLISGNGSNLQAILDAVDGGELPDTEVGVVVSNRRDAYGVRRAVQHGVPVVYFPLLPYRNAGRSRLDYDADLATIVRGFGVDWVVLAGWMHILSDAFIGAFPGRIVNLHPALPGTLPGTHAIDRAYRAFKEGRIEHTGVMVHLVPDEGVDVGPVVAQMDVPIYPEDTLEELERRIHETEHGLLVSALRGLIAEHGTHAGQR